MILCLLFCSNIQVQYIIPMTPLSKRPGPNLSLSLGEIFSSSFLTEHRPLHSEEMYEWENFVRLAISEMREASSLQTFSRPGRWLKVNEGAHSSSRSFFPPPFSVYSQETPLTLPLFSPHASDPPPLSSWIPSQPQGRSGQHS